jgi:hypothetical protein
MNKPIYVIDSQILNGISECARKAHFQFDRNLEPITKPDYFEKGDLLHQMLAEYYNFRKHRSNWSINNQTHADVVDLCCNCGREAAIKMNLDIETVEEIIKTFRDYCTYTCNDGWDTVIATEEVASKVLFENDDVVLLYQGKIDLIISIMNCEIMPVDHKSSSRRGTPTYLSNQFRGYCWLLGVNNIIINKIGFQKTLKANEKFERHTMSYPSDILEEWRNDAIFQILAYINNSKLNIFPANYTSCDKYSGCIFQPVCSKPVELRDDKLVQLFQERSEKWDVGK